MNNVIDDVDEAIVICLKYEAIFEDKHKGQK